MMFFAILEVIARLVGIAFFVYGIWNVIGDHPVEQKLHGLTFMCFGAFLQ